MTRSEKQAWEQVRSLGRTRYWVREGLLRTGARTWGWLILAQLAFRVIDWVFLVVPDPCPLWGDCAWSACIAVLAAGFSAMACRSHWPQKEAENAAPTEADDAPRPPSD